MDYKVNVREGVTILGDDPLLRGADGHFQVRIATAFPADAVLVAVRGTHATQRNLYIEYVNGRRQQEGRPPLSEQEEAALWNAAADLIVEADRVDIRPDPERIALAFQADELLQRLVLKSEVNYLTAFNPAVRDPIKRAGECWRITPLPLSHCEMAERIRTARIGVEGRPIYYYNSLTGTRYLTYQQFADLGAMDDAGLRQHLCEIQQLAGDNNPHCRPELVFFMAEPWFGAASFAPHHFAAMRPDELRAVYEDLRRQFQAAVPPEFLRDNPDDPHWRRRMFSALITEGDEVVPEELLLGLSPEFFMQIQWLPGGRLVNGELLLDEAFAAEAAGGQPARCDPNVRDFLYDLVREYDELEYVNVGRVMNSLSRRTLAERCEPRLDGRRDVYIAVLKQRGRQDEVVSILRMQKWGVREHLNEFLPLPQAIYKSEEYTEYVLDRRLGCRQLGMNIPRRITARRINELYRGPAGVFPIWSPYFERAYVRGIATDKMPRERFGDEDFATRFAALLGAAAAPNLILGRCDRQMHVLFDDGDEVVREDKDRLPVEIIVADQTGTFNDYQHELHVTAPAYAEPINRRLAWLPNPEQFAQVYLDAFLDRFRAILERFRSRKATLESMFANRKYDPSGSFAFRWEQVLNRLDRSDPSELADLIRASLLVKLPL